MRPTGRARRPMGRAARLTDPGIGQPGLIGGVQPDALVANPSVTDTVAMQRLHRACDPQHHAAGMDALDVSPGQPVGYPGNRRRSTE